MRLDVCGERLDGGNVEKRSHRHRRVERPPQSGGDLSSHQGVATEFKEVVVEADSFHSENIRNHLRDNLFHRRGGCTEFADLERGDWQCATIQLAVRRQGDFLHDHERGRNHVLGKLLRDGSREHLSFEGRVTVRDDVRDKLIADPFVVVHQDDGLHD
ncbi:hypothetical protein JCM9803A_28560 [Rhodococcus erythropolis]